MKDKLFKTLSVLTILGVISFAIHTLHEDNKAFDKRMKKLDKIRLEKKNAQCRVLRENDTDLYGRTCRPLEGDIWEVQTLSGVFVQVHKSRIAPNEQNNLIIPYKENK